MRFFYLLARSRWLLRRLNAAHARLDREETDTASRTLFVGGAPLARLSREIGGMLGLRPPPHVVQMRLSCGSRNPDAPEFQFRPWQGESGRDCRDWTSCRAPALAVYASCGLTQLGANLDQLC